jgi:hypothetical protein
MCVQGVCWLWFGTKLAKYAAMLTRQYIHDVVGGCNRFVWGKVGPVVLPSWHSVLALPRDALPHCCTAAVAAASCRVADDLHPLRVLALFRNIASLLLCRCCCYPRQGC